MDRRIAGLLGAAAALSVVSAAQATPAQTPELAPANSYRDLLDPIANVAPLLKAEDARRAEQSTTKLAQVSVQLGPHHHHHHRIVVVPHHHHPMVVVHHHHHHPHSLIVVH